MKRRFLFTAGGANDNGGGEAPKKLTGEVSTEQVSEWKKKHSLGVYAIVVGGHIAYFKTPGFDELNYGYSKYEPDKALEMWRAIADNTFLGGSEEILQNATLFSGAKNIIQRKADGVKAELLDL